MNTVIAMPTAAPRISSRDAGGLGRARSADAASGTTRGADGFWCPHRQASTLEGSLWAHAGQIQEN